MRMLILCDFLRRGLLSVSQKMPIRTSDAEIDACSHGITRVVVNTLLNAKAARMRQVVLWHWS